MENLSSASSRKRNTKARKAKNCEINTETPFEILCAADEQINPAILLAEELMRKGITESFDFAEIERAEKVLHYAREEISKTESNLTALIKTPSAPSASIPLGF